MSIINPQKALTSADVAKYLGIPKRAARQLMRDLPHANVSWNINSTKKRLRITEQTLNDYLNGRIVRNPACNEED